MNTDPELCAKVAKAIGLEATDEACVPESCWVKANYYEEISHAHVFARTFTPDLPGADFCEALAWVFAQGYHIRIDQYDGEPHSVACATTHPLAAFPEADVTADTIEQALCRAIVAMSDDAS